MNPESAPQIFVVVRHFYGIASTAAIMLACMDDAAAVALSLGMPDVAATIKLAFVDDCLNSLDLLSKLKKLKEDLDDFMTSRVFSVKVYALTGSRPDKSLSPDEFLLVGGWYWWPITDNMRLKVPQIFQGRKQKGKFKPGTVFLDIDYLWPVFRFGQLDIKRNFGFAKHPKQATLIVYFDAGHEGEMFLFHLQYETETPGKYHTEFLFSSHCLVPMGRNVPHSELDSAYRASRQANIILDWLQQFIVRKVLLGDAQVCLFWILNRIKRTNTFIRNRTHAISRTFSDAEIFYIPTAHNPADIATQFRAGFGDSYLQL